MTSMTTSPAARRSGRAEGLDELSGQQSTRWALLSDTAKVRAIMLWAGGALLPLGLFTIVLGWYGTANTPYLYDQLSYVVSGGFLGLGLTGLGGFLLFGAWLAQIAEQGRETSARLAEALEALTAAQGAGAASGVQDVRLVTAGRGATLHRSDCGLIHDRADLVAAPRDVTDLTACRVCKPLETLQV